LVAGNAFPRFYEGELHPNFDNVMIPAAPLNTMRGLILHLAWFAMAPLLYSRGAAEDTPSFEREIAPLLKAHCVKCHGPAKKESELNLSTSGDINRGNKQGAVIVAHDLEASRLWTQIASDEMPPESPLTQAQKSAIRNWIVAGAPGLSPYSATEPSQMHWAFRPLDHVYVPELEQVEGLVNEVDFFVETARLSRRVQANPEADQRELIRRVSLDVTGLPPSLAEQETFLSDSSSDAYSRMIDYYLSSPQYGVRWGKHWLDAVGYADSNGYFNADSDRPLAYRYRDYVVKSLNQDKPLDRFVIEQIAGDEAVRYTSGQIATPETIEHLEATHFLRNGQDGSGESDGNPDEVRADRYYALESAMQNTSTSLLGLTIQCAKCHDHKFEPISQLDYYRWQAVFYPSFHIERWIKPKDRFIYAPLPIEQQSWEHEVNEANARVTTLRADFSGWSKSNRVRGQVLFEDNFDSEVARVADQWNNTVPNDDSQAGSVAVKLDSESPPAAMIQSGELRIIEGGTQGDSWLSTKSKFDWTPDQIGDSIQVTFDLVDNQLRPTGQAASRIGYLIAIHDFNDSSAVVGGNLLIDGNPTSGSSIHLDYPGADSRTLGTLGSTGYAPGQNYGIRVTNLGMNKYRLEHLVNSYPEEKSIDLNGGDLPDGGFGFEYCCGRSFVVDNVVVEFISASPAEGSLLAEYKKRRGELESAVVRQKQLAENRPGKIAWGGDMASELPEVRLLTRGNYSTPGAVVTPGTFSALVDDSNPFSSAAQQSDERSSGRRLAWAQWVTRPGSRAAALMARVQVNRVWHQYFGKGIVATPENLGISGAPPSHPELLDWLSAKLIRDGWSMKSLHRAILNSSTYRLSAVVEVLSTKIGC
jgi:hypothetical protein